MSTTDQERDCPSCKYSDSWGIATKACLATCCPQPSGKGSNWEPLNTRVTTPPAPQSAGDSVDAARYRWLREHYVPGSGRFETDIDRAFLRGAEHEIDGAIDAAMSAQKEKP